MIKIAIAMPVYNGQKYVKEAIGSILSQSYTAWELHVVDDCSLDGTCEIIESFKDSRIKLHKNKENIGLVRNFNSSLNYCQSEYISIFHQDDIMMSDNLKEKMLILDKYQNAGLIHSNIEVINASGEVVNKHWYEHPAKDYIIKKSDFIEKMMVRNMVCMPSVIIRRDVLNKVGKFDEQLSYCCDYELWLRIASEYDIAYLNKILIQYRLHESNETGRFIDKIEGLREERMARLLALEKTNMPKFKSLANINIRRKTLNLILDHYVGRNLPECRRLIMFYLRYYYLYVFNRKFVILLLSVLVASSIPKYGFMVIHRIRVVVERIGNSL